jgi:Transposase, Mutator family
VSVIDGSSPSSGIAGATGWFARTGSTVAPWRGSPARRPRRAPVLLRSNKHCPVARPRLARLPKPNRTIILGRDSPAFRIRITIQDSRSVGYGLSNRREQVAAADATGPQRAGVRSEPAPGSVRRCSAPKVSELLEAAEEDLIAFYASPPEHWTKVPSTNPLERINKEIGRRTDIVGIFLNDQAVIRLAGALLSQQNDEWLVQRRYLSVESMALTLAESPEPTPPEQPGDEVPSVTAP